MSVDLNSIVAAAHSLFPDVVWVFLGYVVLLDALQVVRQFRVNLKDGFGKALAETLRPDFLVNVVVQDATAQHAISLAATGFMIGLAAGKDLKTAALGAILGAATASVADARETFWSSFKQTFGIA